MTKHKKAYPKNPSEVYFKDNVLVASKGARRVSWEEKQSIRKGRILKNLDVNLHGAYL